MTSVVSRSVLGGFGLAAALTLATAGTVLSQDDSKTPPPWPSLVHCAEMGDESDRLNCYDTAMRAAGYAPKPEAVTAARHKLFGLAAPNILKHKDKREAAAAPATVREDADNVTVTLEQVARLHDNKLLLITTEGAIWEQTDDVEVAPTPKAGQEVAIRRNRFGGYFCDVSRYKSVRCTRSR